MTTIILSLLERKHGTAFTDSARGPRGQPAYHPLDRVNEMLFRFRDWNPDYMEPGEDLERVALVLHGDTPPSIGLKPTVLGSERHYRVPRLVVFRESVVGYRMRAVCVSIPVSEADAFEAELVAVKRYMTGSRVIGTLASIATGHRENEHPPLSHVWDPKPITASSERTDVFVFLQINYEDRPGGRDRQGCWIRLKGAYIFEGVVSEGEGERQFSDFNALWPLLDETSLVPQQ
jgi:hypothetical protein